ncbi:MAG: hypothetical protein ACRC9Q_03625 [Bacteroidales bacterium]
MKVITFITLITLTFGCKGITKKADNSLNSTAAEETRIIGGAKDQNGCLTSAGYIWSKIRKDCIRLFESGIRLSPVPDTSNCKISGFLVFGNDSTSTELFLPALKESEILVRKNNSYTSADEIYSLKREYSTWILSQNDTIIYKSE